MGVYWKTSLRNVGLADIVGKPDDIGQGPFKRATLIISSHALKLFSYAKRQALHTFKILS